MYKTCEEYVLTCLETVKAEKNRIQAEFVRYKNTAEKELALDRELIARNGEAVRWLKYLIGKLGISVDGDTLYVSPVKLTGNETQDLIRFLQDNDRLKKEKKETK